MAFSRKKPVPTRRGRLRPGGAAASEVAVESAGEVAAETPAEAEAEAETVSPPARASSGPAAKGGLEMALIVVTLVSLIAAFALLQLEMHRAFEAGWPV